MIPDFFFAIQASIQWVVCSARLESAPKLHQQRTIGLKTHIFFHIWFAFCLSLVKSSSWVLKTTKIRTSFPLGELFRGIFVTALVWVQWSGPGSPLNTITALRAVHSACTDLSCIIFCLATVDVFAAHRTQSVLTAEPSCCSLRSCDQSTEFLHLHGVAISTFMGSCFLHNNWSWHQMFTEGWY